MKYNINTICLVAITVSILASAIAFIYEAKERQEHFERQESNNTTISGRKKWKLR